jgi:hypothetical protein
MKKNVSSDYFLVNFSALASRKVQALCALVFGPRLNLRFCRKCVVLSGRKKIIRLELCSFSFDFLVGHEPRIFRFSARANAESEPFPRLSSELRTAFAVPVLSAAASRAD